MESDDLLRQMGYLALGSRMKRLGERLQGEVAAIAADQDVAIPPAQHTLIFLLDTRGPSTIGDLAALLGITQPAISRAVAKLAAAKLVAVTVTNDDRRVRSVGLTRQGRSWVERMRADLWPRIESAVADACTGLSGPLLDQIAGLEDAIAERPLARRGRRA